MIQSPAGDVLCLEGLTQWGVAEWQSIIDEKFLLGSLAPTATRRRAL
jgi:hypothetical protein